MSNKFSTYNFMVEGGMLLGHRLLYLKTMQVLWWQDHSILIWKCYANSQNQNNICMGLNSIPYGTNKMRQLLVWWGHQQMWCEKCVHSTSCCGMATSEHLHIHLITDVWIISFRMSSKCIPLGLEPLTIISKEYKKKYMVPEKNTAVSTRKSSSDIRTVHDEERRASQWCASKQIKWHVISRDKH